jgi:uncharacterized tellurite resistance protein B-like protein
MNLWKLLGIEKEQKNQERFGRLFDGIQAALGDRAEDEVKLVTGFAGLLGKVAYADLEISQKEIGMIRTLLQEKMNLRDSQLGPILKLIELHCIELFSLEDYIYTRMINDVCDRQQKLELIDAMFSVAAANKSISSHEDGVIGGAYKDLQLTHKEFISIKSRYKDHLDVLKG